MWQRIALLGATGSIGKQTVDVLKRSNMLDRVVALSANSNVDALLEISKLCPNASLCIADDNSYAELKRMSNKKVYGGIEGIKDMLSDQEPDLTVVSVSGAAGFLITIASIQNTTKRICLATKEALVIGGKFVKERLKKYSIELLPIDSEHSAIFQLLLGEKNSSIKRLVLTASGGALRDHPIEKFDEVRINDVLKHPVWSMGKRITIDSATMVNKAFEVVEAHHLFELEKERIDVTIHREGLVHSLVEFVDGSIKLHAGYPDMRIPISYSIFFPDRMEFENDRHIEIGLLKNLTFEPPDPKRYPAFFMIHDLFEMPSSAWIVYNAADEVAVQKFLEGKIRFTDISRLISSVVERFDHFEPKEPNEVMLIDQKARKLAEEEVERWA